jgi:hypothetical protein
MPGLVRVGNPIDVPGTFALARRGRSGVTTASDPRQPDPPSRDRAHLRSHPVRHKTTAHTTGILVIIGTIPPVRPDHPKNAPASLVFAPSCAMLQRGRLSQTNSLTMRLMDLPEPQRGGWRMNKVRTHSDSAFSLPMPRTAPGTVPVPSLGREVIRRCEHDETNPSAGMAGGSIATRLTISKPARPNWQSVRRRDEPWPRETKRARPVRGP